jgi:hypothetical protein
MIHVAFQFWERGVSGLQAERGALFAQGSWIKVDTLGSRWNMRHKQCGDSGDGRNA